MRTTVVLLLSLLSTAATAQTMTPAQTQARLGLQFLDRTQLTGSEAEAMIAVRRLLTAIADGQLTLHPPGPPPTPSAEQK